MTEWTLFVIILVFNAVLAGAIAIILKRRHAAPGRVAMIWMLAGLSIWAFGYAMITISQSPALKILWLRFENLGILTVPVFWFFFVAQYAQVDKWLTRYTAPLFFIIPLVSFVLILSDSLFRYYYAELAAPEGLGPVVVTARGPWYLVAVIYAYVLNLCGMAVLLWRFFYYRSVYRRQLGILLSAVLIPLAFNIFYQFAPQIFPVFSVQYDLTPITFTITAIMLSAGIFGLQLFDLIPIARHIVLEHIPEMVFVLDAHDRLLDANSAAQQALGKSLDEIVGRDPLEIFHDWQQMIARFLTADSAHAQIQIPGDPPITLEVDISPLYNQFGRLDGRLIVAHDITEHKWLEDDLKYANESLRNQLDEIKRLREKLEEQAIRDPLTNVYNRRYLSEFLDNAIARACRDHTPVTIVILDMDDFKRFNDLYGHKCGDEVLLAMTKFLCQHTRQGDVVCRYGGEEFVVLMPQVDLNIGYERAETWRQDFSETPIVYDGVKLFAAFSAGVATYPQHGASGDALLQAADTALYRSKDAGKNRVTLFKH